MARERRIVRVRGDDGYTMVELVVVIAILMSVVTALTALFVSGAKAEVELNRRFEAQQAARVAVDRLRREVHCASGVTVSSAASITVTLPAHCPSAGGAVANVVYEAELVAAGRYRLRRAGVTIADYLTSGDVFSYVAPSSASLGKLHLDVPVNVNPADGWKTWRLETDVVLRNTTRS
ncbi:MAG TPA: type II secretion system protein [Gaiellaceae bacterium]|nr:type II secretion system protein [Gaiellaceae bacterium]